MADLSKELNQIRTALFGKDVRNSLANGIEKINEENEKTVTVVSETLNNINTDMKQFSSDEEERKTNETTRINDFKLLKNEFTTTIENGSNEVSKLEVLEKEYSSKLEDLNNSNSLEQVKKDISTLSDKHIADIEKVENSIVTNTGELNKFIYSKVGNFSIEKSKTGMIRISGWKNVTSSKDGTWVTVNLPITLPNNNYIVNLTCVDGRVDNSFRRIKLGNNQNPKSFDVFIDWCTGFDFEVVCPPN